MTGTGQGLPSLSEVHFSLKKQNSEMKIPKF